ARRPARLFNAGAGAVIDLSGASGIFDTPGVATTLSSTPVWTNAGRLAGLGGGDVSKATISARAGAPAARGGTFDWYNAVLRQNGTSAIPKAAAATGNIVFADQLMNGG